MTGANRTARGGISSGYIRATATPPVSSAGRMFRINRLALICLLKKQAANLDTLHSFKPDPGRFRGQLDADYQPKVRYNISFGIRLPLIND